MSLNSLPHTPLSSSDSPIPPPTPLSPTSQGVTLADDQSRGAGPVRRKASRRANTAERRATHNAVERQRRETLNGRFLDLAALLPNLASVRRPSKSAIVNSSIALIHTLRRARAIAGRELRTIKSETDAIRRELNEWRDRASLPRVEEPPRSGDFLTLLSLEEEDIGEDERRAYELRDRDDGEEDGGDEDEIPESNVRIGQVHHMQHSGPIPQQHFPPQAPRMTVHTTGLTPYDGSVGASLYDAHSMTTPVSAISLQGSPDPDKVAAWNAHHLYSAMAQTQPQPWVQAAPQSAQASLFTPPNTGHGGPSNGGAPPNPFALPANQAFLTNYQRQNTQSAPSNNTSNTANAGNLFQGSPTTTTPATIIKGEDDASSVGSAHDSARGSPHHSTTSAGSSSSPTNPFDMHPALSSIATGAAVADFNSTLDSFPRQSRGFAMTNGIVPHWGAGFSGAPLLPKTPLAVGGGASYQHMGLLM